MTQWDVGISNLLTKLTPHGIVLTIPLIYDQVYRVRASVVIVNYPTRAEDGWLKLIQLAVNDRVCVPFDELVENKYRAFAGELRHYNMVDDDPWLDYLAGRAVTLIEHFGDARDPKPLSELN